MKACLWRATWGPAWGWERALGDQTGLGVPKQWEDYIQGKKCNFILVKGDLLLHNVEDRRTRGRVLPRMEVRQEYRDGAGGWQHFTGLCSLVQVLGSCSSLWL